MFTYLRPAADDGEQVDGDAEQRPRLHAAQPVVADEHRAVRHHTEGLAVQRAHRVVNQRHAARTVHLEGRAVHSVHRHAVHRQFAAHVQVLRSLLIHHLFINNAPIIHQ